MLGRFCLHLHFVNKNLNVAKTAEDKPLEAEWWEKYGQWGGFVWRAVERETSVKDRDWGVVLTQQLIANSIVWHTKFYRNIQNILKTRLCLLFKYSIKHSKK